MPSWWAFLRLTDPGYLGDDEGNWRRVVSTWLTVSGYVLFMGTLIAILTQWLNRTMRALEQGLTPITVRGAHCGARQWAAAPCRSSVNCSMVADASAPFCAVCGGAACALRCCRSVSMPAWHTSSGCTARAAVIVRM